MTTNREIFKHAAIYSAATVLGKAIGFVMLPFYAHVFRGEGYGVIGMVDATLNFLMTLFSYGITGGIIRIYHEEQGENKAKVVSTATILLWIACALVAVPMILLGKPLSGWLLDDPSSYPLLWMALLSFILDITGGAASTLLVIQQRSVTFSVVNLVRLFFGLGLNIWFILILNMGLTGYFLASVLTALFATIVFHVYAIRHSGWKYDARIARKIAAFELPLVPGNLVSFASRQAERVLLRFMIGIESVGIYEMGCKFPSFLTLLIVEPFMRSWTTKRTEMAESPDASEQIGKMFTLFMFLLLGAGLVMGVTIEPVIRVLTPREFWPSVRIAKIEILTAIVTAAYYHVFFGLFYRKQTHAISMIRGVTSVLKIGISYVCIAAAGINGAAYAALVASFIQTAWAGIKAHSLYPMKLEYRKIITMLTVGGALYLFLETVDLRRLGLVQMLINHVFPAAVEALRATPLGTWKGGGPLGQLAARIDDMAIGLVRGVAALSFLVLFPWIHDGTRVRLFGRSS
jgi:O-antigen/teichoic acid export membrane protein